MMNNKIKLGVSLYSFSSEYINVKLSLEDILARVKSMGYKGIELVAAQMVPDYPNPSEKWLIELKELLDKYELQPVCWSAYIDMGLRSDRDLSESEIIQFTINDMIYAKKAGFPLVRTQYSISPEIMRKMIPYCKSLNMKLAIEMHHPHHPEVPVWKEYIALMKGEGKGWLGMVPDCGIFQNHPHQLYIDQALEMGFREDKLNRVIELHDVDTPIDMVLEGLNDVEKRITKELYETFNHPATVEQLKDIIDISFYIHGKFYYLEEGKNDACIPYHQILPEIRELGYEGFIACEYEGHHFTDELDTAEQLNRYVNMNKRILGL
jgi:sugar phosphate isomerase/epimerase